MNFEIKKIDQVLDYTHLVSAANTLYKAISKIALKAINDIATKSSKIAHEYFSISKLNSLFRMIPIYVPVIGKLMVYVNDAFRKKQTLNLNESKDEDQSRGSANSASTHLEALADPSIPNVNVSQTIESTSIIARCAKKYKTLYPLEARNSFPMIKGLDLASLRRIYFQKLSQQRIKLIT